MKAYLSNTSFTVIVLNELCTQDVTIGEQIKVKNSIFNHTPLAIIKC